MSRRTMLASAGALTGVLLVGCGRDDDSGASAAGETDQYFGWVFNRPEMTAIALEVESAAAGTGLRKMRAYVCDGVGMPDGLALWFTGDVDLQQVAKLDEGIDVKSAGGREVLRLGYLDEREVRGVLTAADGRKSRFVAYPSTAGAGIYQVTVDDKFNFTGTSTGGSKLEARYVDEGTLVGAITTRDGEKIGITRMNVALASPSQRAQFGYAERHAQFADQAKVPGQFVAVISPNGSHWFGRSGNVRGGSPGAAIIGLDMSD